MDSFEGPPRLDTLVWVDPADLGLGEAISAVVEDDDWRLGWE